MIKRIFIITREALSGAEYDLTEGKVFRAILILAIPMILEMMMESVFAVVDIFFVSKLGHDAVTAVGITESVMTLVYALGIGISAATTAVVARRTGEKMPEKAASASGQSIILAVLFSLPLMIAGIFFSSDILQLMGADINVKQIGTPYTSIVLGSNVVIMLLFVINAVFRSSGDAAMAMKVLWLANGLNIILDPLLIFGFSFIPAMGVQGAAIATTLGRSIAVMYQLYVLFFKNKRFRLKIKHFALDSKVMILLLKLSQGGIFQYLISTVSWIAMIRIISSFGSISVAAYTIAVRVVLFVMLPAWGLAGAAATLTGQNLGAGKPERAAKAVKITAWLNMAYMTLSGLILLFASEFLIRLFIDEQTVIEKGAFCLRYLAYGFTAFGIGLVFMQAFNGAGDTRTPMRINLVVFWIIEIPLAYYLAINQSYAEEGVYITILIADFLMAAIAVSLFSRGKWKLKKV